MLSEKWPERTKGHLARPSHSHSSAPTINVRPTMLDEGEGNGTCRFCGQKEASWIPGGEFAVCEECAAGIRELIQGHPNMDGEVFGFEPVGYDYQPNVGEIMYLSSRDQFYEIELRTGSESTMIFLQPIPKNRQVFPITDISDEIGKAIGEDAFYRVSVDTDELLEREAWWRSALAMAPDPPEVGHGQT